MTDQPKRTFEPDDDLGKVELLNGLYEGMISVGQEQRQTVQRIGFGVVTLLLVATGVALNRPIGLGWNEKFFWSVGMVWVVMFAHFSINEIWKRYQGVYFCIGRINQVQRGHVAGEYLEGVPIFPESFKRFLPDEDGKVANFEPIFRITKWMMFLALLICVCVVTLVVETAPSPGQGPAAPPSSPPASTTP